MMFQLMNLQHAPIILGEGRDLTNFFLNKEMGFRVDRHKKKHNIQTYKEILAFTEGKTLSEIEQAREDGKRPYQKILFIVGSALLAFVVTACMYLIYQLL